MVFKHPLFLFSILGLSLFFLESLNNYDRQEIIVTVPQQQRLATLWETQTGYVATPDQLDSLVANYIEEEVLDGLCCYSAVNQGQLNQTIVDAVIAHLEQEKFDENSKIFLSSMTSISTRPFDSPNAVSMDSDSLDLLSSSCFN